MLIQSAQLAVFVLRWDRLAVFVEFSLQTKVKCFQHKAIQLEVVSDINGSLSMIKYQKSTDQPQMWLRCWIILSALSSSSGLCVFTFTSNQFRDSSVHPVLPQFLIVVLLKLDQLHNFREREKGNLENRCYRKWKTLQCALIIPFSCAYFFLPFLLLSHLSKK